MVQSGPAHCSGLAATAAVGQHSAAVGQGPPGLGAGAEHPTQGLDIVLRVVVPRDCALQARGHIGLGFRLLGFVRRAQSASAAVATAASNSSDEQSLTHQTTVTMLLCLGFALGLMALVFRV